MLLCQHAVEEPLHSHIQHDIWAADRHLKLFDEGLCSWRRLPLWGGRRSWDRSHEEGVGLGAGQDHGRMGELLQAPQHALRHGLQDIDEAAEGMRLAQVGLRIELGEPL